MFHKKQLVIHAYDLDTTNTALLECCFFTTLHVCCLFRIVICTSLLIFFYNSRWVLLSPDGHLVITVKIFTTLDGCCTGGRLQPVLMRHTRQLCVEIRGGGAGGGSGGGRLGGVGGGFRLGGGFPKWGGLRATHYYHMHTSWGVVCLGVGGYGGMYAIIALSRPC